ncbi:MAG: tetratricopeptide repeat protein [Syntrophales bacterium]|nr:tetratricopeptide repeat protein [Syntrophales bacterium]
MEKTLSKQILLSPERSILRCLLMAAMAVALIITVSCATNHRNREMAEMHLRTGIAGIESGEYTEALRELFEAKRLNPDDSRIYYNMGVSYYARGLIKDSSTAFSRAVDLKPDYSEALNYLGLIRFEEGNYQEAIRFFHKALSNVLYDTPEFALYNLGRAWREQGDRDKSLSYFEQAARIRPNRILPVIHMSTGTLLLSLNRHDEALANLRESVRLAPYVVEFRLALGEAYLAKGMRREAAREFRQIIETAPDSDAAARARAILTSLQAP